MKEKVAVIGAGNMGTVVGKQLPDTVEKLIIDIDEEKAKTCAEEIGAAFSSSLADVGDCDIVAMVVPGPVVEKIVPVLTLHMKKDAILMNMATNAMIDDLQTERYSQIKIIDCKIIGNALAISSGNAPSCVVVNTQDEEVFCSIKKILPGYTLVIQGNSNLVTELNAIGTKEALRCGLIILHQLEKYHLREETKRILLYTVAGGTLQSMADGKLGGNSIRLLKELKEEGALPFDFEIPK